MAKRTIDITGQTYGKLTVLKEVDSNKYARRFLCRCECGNEKIVHMQSLRSGNTSSCGCIQKERVSQSNVKDLTGQQFGKLTVIERVGSDERRKATWLCKCECGQDTIVASDRLLNGMTKSCGCLRIDKGNDLQGYNKANLTVDDVYTPLLKSKLRSDNSTGIKGVYKVERKNGIKYKALITIKGKTIYLGTFDTVDEAKRARQQGEDIYFRPYLD